MCGVSSQLIDFYVSRPNDVMQRLNGALDCVRPFSLDLIDELVQFRGKSVAQRFVRCWTREKLGFVLYSDAGRGRIIGHALLLSAGPKRKLFGFLPIPGDEHFVFFCKVDDRIHNAEAGISKLLATCGSVVRSGRIGISVPRSDCFLRHAVVQSGFSYAKTMLKVSIFHFAVALPWFRSQTLGQKD